MGSNRSETLTSERWTLSRRTVTMTTYTMIEPRNDRVTVCSPQTQHQCYQVIRTTRVHQSSRSSRMVTVQEKVVRSRLQLGYSTPTSFINRYLFIISISSKSRPVDATMTDDHDPLFVIVRQCRYIIPLKLISTSSTLLVKVLSKIFENCLKHIFFFNIIGFLYIIFNFLMQVSRLKKNHSSSIIIYYLYFRKRIYVFGLTRLFRIKCTNLS